MGLWREAGDTMKIAPKPKAGQEVTLENLLSGKAAENITAPSPKLIISNRGSYWRLGPLNLRGGQYYYDLLNGPLDARKERTPKEWAEYSSEAFDNGNFVACAGDVLFAILDFLYSNVKDLKVGADGRIAWAMLSAMTFKKNAPPIAFLSQCYVNPTADPSIVIHDFGIPTTYTSSGSLVGNSGPLALCSNTDEYTKVTLGAPSAKRAREVVGKIGKDAYIFRWPSPPETTQKRPLALTQNLAGYPIIDSFTDAENTPMRAIGVIQREKVEMKK